MYSHAMLHLQHVPASSGPWKAGTCGSGDRAATRGSNCLLIAVCFAKTLSYFSGAVHLARGMGLSFRNHVTMCLL